MRTTGILLFVAVLSLTAACGAKGPGPSPGVPPTVNNSGSNSTNISSPPPAANSTPQSPNLTSPSHNVTIPSGNFTPLPEPVQGPYDVWIEGHEYRPSILTVPVGTTVTWLNKDSDFHTVTSDAGLFDAGLSYMDKFQFTFTKVGTYNYACSPHPDMTGVVYVK